MKRINLNFLTIVWFVSIITGCTTDLNNTSLKSSLSKDAESLTTAVSKITSSSDFQIMTEMSDASSMSKVGVADAGEFMPNDTVLITLDKVAGVYEYSWRRVKSNSSVLRFFTKTAESTQMVVKLPASKIRKPATLFNYNPADSLLSNNFVATVSEYSVFRNKIAGNEYKLTAGFSIDNTNIGTLTELRTKNKVNGLNSSSVYELASGYTVSCIQNSGDTAQSVYSISNGNAVLYEEKLVSVKLANTIKHRENTYSLTIGNVKIVKGKGLNSLDSAKVYLSGVLQANAKVELIIPQTDSVNQSVTDKKRDIKITFDDGTSTTIRTLLADSMDNINKIFAATKQAAFATDIIDRISWNIYSRKQ